MLAICFNFKKWKGLKKAVWIVLLPIMKSQPPHIKVTCTARVWIEKSKEKQWAVQEPALTHRLHVCNRQLLVAMAQSVAKTEKIFQSLSNDLGVQQWLKYFLCGICKNFFKHLSHTLTAIWKRQDSKRQKPSLPNCNTAFTDLCFCGHREWQLWNLLIRAHSESMQEEFFRLDLNSLWPPKKSKNSL